MPSRSDDGTARQLRLFETLQQLLALEAAEARPVLEAGCGVIARALEADAVDVLLHEASADCLVCVGAADTPMHGQLRARGLDRLPVSVGPAAAVFRSGASRSLGDVGRTRDAHNATAAAVGGRGALLCRVAVAGAPRGLLRVVSERPHQLAAVDLPFLETVCRWMGLILGRAELVERLEREVVERGRREGTAATGVLTSREREVAARVAEGLTNEEIAERLVLVAGTVSNHVEHILRKLGVTRRVQVATWAIQHGLGGDGDPTTTLGSTEPAPTPNRRRR